MPKKTHGKSHTWEYKVWKRMLRQVSKMKKTHKFKILGCKIGYIIDERWFKFEEFYKDMGKAPVEGMGLIKNRHAAYMKENCEWGFKNYGQKPLDGEQFFEKPPYRLSKQQLDELVKKSGLSRQLIYTRARRGWSLARLTSSPYPRKKEKTIRVSLDEF